MNEAKNKPIQGKIGGVRYKVWTNQDKAGKTRVSVDIYRTYRVDEAKRKEKDDGWRESHNFSCDDLKVFPSLLDEIAKVIQGLDG